MRTRKRAPWLAVLALVLLAGTVAVLDHRSPATANDAETSALIGYFNEYRASLGLSPLGVHPQINADAQAQAEADGQSCGYGLPYPPLPSSVHGYAQWINTFQAHAAGVWSSIQGVPAYLDAIAKPSYNAAGVGHIVDDHCNYFHIWVIVVANADGGGPPPPTPAPTAGPSGSPTPTATQAPTAAPTPSPTATPSPVHPPGDADCDTLVTPGDVVLVLKLAAGVTTAAPCLPPAGVNCTGGIDFDDAFAMLEYLGGVPYALPDGCPRLGATA